jgi:hypothetical protein
MEALKLKPGPETLAIKNFIKSATWEGHLPAGALGLNAPALPSRGALKGKWSVNGLWLVAEIESVLGSGEEARVWKAVWVCGWDFGHQEYRGAFFDSFGSSSMMRGVLRGHTLSFESMDDVIRHGQATRLRFTFDNSGDQGVQITAEHTVNGTFVVDEQQIHIPSP